MGVARVCVLVAESIKTISFILCMYRRLFATGEGHPHLLYPTRSIRENPATLERSERQRRRLRRRRPVDKGEKLGTNV